jgi:hypothetical protein
MSEFQNLQAKRSEWDLPDLKRRLTAIIRYSIIRPVQFSNGNIVEAQFVFLLVLVHQDKYQLQLILQGLTRLSNKFSQVRLISSM